MINAGSPIKNFVRKSLEQIEAGLPKGYKIAGKIDFELSVVSKNSAKGGLNIQVLGLGGDIKNEHAQKMRFSVVNKKDAKQDLQNVKETLEHLAKIDQDEVIEVKKVKKK